MPSENRSPSVASDTAALPADHAGLVEILEAVEEWRKWAFEWSGSAFVSGEKITDPDAMSEAEHKTELYSGLCKLGNHMCWLAEAIAAFSRVGPVAVKLLDESWEGLDCYCGGGWKVGHADGCPEGADLATSVATAVMRWVTPHLKHIVSFNTLRECVAAELPATPPATQPALALIEELESFLTRINQLASPNPERTFDNVIADMGYIADYARTALASAKRFKTGG